MERMFGTVVRGVRAPIIREGDDLAAIVADTVVAALQRENIPIGEKDVVATVPNFSRNCSLVRVSR